MKLVRIIQNEMFCDAFLAKYNTKYTKKNKKTSCYIRTICVIVIKSIKTVSIDDEMTVLIQKPKRRVYFYEKNS